MVFISKEELHVSAYSGHLQVFFDGIHLTIEFKRTTGMTHLIIYEGVWSFLVTSVFVPNFMETHHCVWTSAGILTWAHGQLDMQVPWAYCSYKVNECAKSYDVVWSRVINWGRRERSVVITAVALSQLSTESWTYTNTWSFPKYGAITWRACLHSHTVLIIVMRLQLLPELVLCTDSGDLYQKLRFNCLENNCCSGGIREKNNSIELCTA